MAHWIAYLIRFEFDLDSAEIRQMLIVLPFMLIFKVVVFHGFGLYRGMWRYSGIPDLWKLLKATGFSTIAITSAILFTHRFGGFSRAVFILDGALTFLFAGGLRFLIRMLHQNFVLGEKKGVLFPRSLKRGGVPVFIIGAGDAGEKTFRELVDNPRLHYRVVGFLDDDPSKRGRAIHGVPVVGKIGDLVRESEKRSVKDVLIAVPSATGDQMRRIVESCEQARVRYKTLPGMGELIGGKVSVKALRDVNFDDLLGRPPVELDVENIQEYIKDKCVLVTGAGGSIGSELCRQLIRFNPGLIILMDASEANLYNIQMELKHRVQYLKYVTLLGNVRDHNILERLFTRYQPHVVFHAAAYKHVPLLERNPWQAVQNNIVGSRVVMEFSVAHHVERFVLVSTDKAVRPTGVMGASKRVCELLMQSQVGNGARMMAVRFGNVVGSSGSVIPLFRQQIARGGPVTVTHPDVMRYFMTIPEAAKLIIQAGAQGEGGEIFILEMGTPVRIADMARDLIHLSGKDPEKDIQIIFTGLRHGEKLYEELITEGEGIIPTKHEKILALKANGYCNGIRTNEEFRDWLVERIKAVETLAEAQDACGVKRALKELVPEYAIDPSSECIF